MRTYTAGYRTHKVIVIKREREIMKIKLLLSLILGLSLGASAELVEQFNFGDDGTVYSSISTL